MMKNWLLLSIDKNVLTKHLLSSDEAEVDDGDDGHGEDDAADGDQESRNSVVAGAGFFDRLRVGEISGSTGQDVDVGRVNVRRLDGQSSGHGVLQVTGGLLASYFAEM